MGRDIVRQESSWEPRKRSILWHQEECLDVLQHRQGTPIIRGLVLDMRTFQNERSKESGSADMQKFESRSFLLLDWIHILLSIIWWLFGCVSGMRSSFRETKEHKEFHSDLEHQIKGDPEGPWILYHIRILRNWTRPKKKNQALRKPKFHDSQACAQESVSECYSCCLRHSYVHYQGGGDTVTATTLHPLQATMLQLVTDSSLSTCLSHINQMYEASEAGACVFLVWRICYG
ncbi:hypothetical protein L1987_83698 [Smallanthus sonchifolius]|uniref:Uncharacterized protein n=1 Tax=Smallanthus sonchifolius TaxID=185202 RepID=A0ACB8YCV4_9ASTR|nr:hypothetical protein L1987_83698 [Smallanthus sonchifolius]